MRIRSIAATGTRGSSPLNPYSGSLLVALPSLLDANFRRTILFLSHHDSDDGSIGFVLNRPRKERLGEMSMAPDGLEGVPVYEGGPVENHHLILTRLIWNPEGVQFQSLGEDDLRENDQESGSGLRAFTGYAGWSAGQLEGEIEEKTWVVLPPTAAMLEPVLTIEEGISRWKSLMKELGPWYHLLSEAPDDPKLN